jgi:hypothetical protein
VGLSDLPNTLVHERPVPRVSAALAARFRAFSPRLGRVLLVAAPAVGIWLVFLITGLRGIAFGFHWDEVESHVEPTRRMLQSGILLPKIYTYPMLTKWLILVPALPAGLGSALDGAEPQRIQAAMLAAMDAPGYLLGLRRFFVFLSSLTILSTYAAALVLGHRPWQALVAAGGLGLSWEFAYHSRFVVPDCLVVSFCGLALLGLALQHRTRQARYLYAVAVVVGLATGTKYPAVFLLGPLLLASAFSLPARAVVAQAWRMAALSAVSFAAYLVSTPATLLDPFEFMRGTQFISKYYATSKHGGYTVATAAEHAKLLFEYLCLDYFSAYRPLAIALFLACIFGAVQWLRRDRRLGLVLLALPIGFASLFCIKYRLVTMRNYLFFTPFMAVLLARAAADLEALIPKRYPRWPLAGVLGALGLLQAGWLIWAAESIRNASPKADARKALAYVREHPSTRFRVSAGIHANAGLKESAKLPRNVTRGAADAVVFLRRTEGPGPWDWNTNDPWLFERVFGPREVNLNWYSSWGGYDHVVIMSFEKAKATGAPITR